MQLWSTIKACSVDQTGPLVAGRLCGAAFQIAMHLQITRSDGTTLSGADAISCPDISATTGNVGDKSGGGYLLDRLIEEYGVHDQEQTTMALDQFFNHTREGYDLASYLTTWRLYLEEAQELGGLQLNNVAKSYLLLRCSGLPKNKQDDIKLKVSGDLDKFGEIWSILNRMAKAETTKESNSTASMMHYGERGYDEEEDEYETYYTNEPEGQEGEWSDDDDNFGTYWWDETSYTYSFAVESELDDHLWDEYGTFKGYRKGKGKGKSKGRTRFRGNKGRKRGKGYR